MDEQFVRSVEHIGTIYRNRCYRELGNAPLIKQLPFLMNKYLGQPSEDCSEIIIGENLVHIINQAIDGLNPESNDKNNAQVRSYIYLSEYLIKGKELKFVEDNINISRSSFYKIRKQAMELLALKLWELEQREESKMKSNILNNVDRSTYTNFIERYNSNGESIIDKVIIPELRDGRSWIVSLTGNAGVGKTSIAHQTATRIVAGGRNLRLPFEAVIWIQIRQGEPQPGKDSLKGISVMASMASVYDVIGNTLEKRSVYKSTFEEKKRIVLEAIREHVCLFVIDNLDSEWILDETFKEDLEAFMQSLSHPHKVLVTLRANQPWAGAKNIEIKKMSREEARNLLHEEANLKYQMPFSNEEFELVYEKTYGVPLAMKWVLGLTRSFGYPLNEALDYQSSGRGMLDFFFEMAYNRLQVSAKKILFAISLFNKFGFPGPLMEMTSLSGPEISENLGKLYRGHIIELTSIKEKPDYGYSLLPFVKEYLGRIKQDPKSKINDILVQDFINSALDKMTNYYINSLKVSRGQKERVLWILKFEKFDIFQVMEWCWRNDDHRFVESLKMIGIFLGTLHYLLDREEWGKKAVEYLRKTQRNEEANWHLIYDVGWSLIRKGTVADRQLGRKIIEEGLDEARKNNWKLNIAIALTNIGKLLVNEGNYEKAEEKLNESKLLFEDSKKDDWINVYLRVVADLRQNQGKYDEAIKTYEQLEEKYLKIGDIDNRIEIMSSLALTLVKKGNVENSFNIADASVELAETIAPPAYSLAFALKRRAEMNVLCEKFDAAIEDFKKAQSIFQALGISYEVDQIAEQLNDLRERV